MKIIILLFSVLLLNNFAFSQSYPNSRGVETAYNYIRNVSLLSINNTTTGSDADGDTYKGYDYFPALSATLQPGSTYTLSVEIVADYNDYVTAFIDWNDDGDFQDADETIVVAAGVSTNGPHTASINVPLTAVDISTRMRISHKYGAAPLSDETFNFGEVEDYVVNTYTDTDGDGVANILDIDDDNDGIEDANDVGLNCYNSQVYLGGTAGKIYSLNLNTGSVSLATTSTLWTGDINSLASNPDAGVLYYGGGTSIYVYNPTNGNHSLVQDLSGLISGGNLENAGAAYYNGNLYIGPEDGSGVGTFLYKIPVSTNGLSFTASPTSIGNPSGIGYGYSDMVILSNGSSGILYGYSDNALNFEFWKFDLSTNLKTSILTGTGFDYTLGLDLNGRLWRGDGTSIQKIDFNGNTYGSAYSATESITDMTAPFNCVQGDFTLDTDGDGIVNILDLDDDGDGIPDNVEAQSTNAYVAPSSSDTDGDGLDNAYDVDNGGSVIGSIDTDGDNSKDFMDTDADNQGSNDITEAGLSLTASDSDSDGLDDAIDVTTGYSDPNGSIDTPNTLPDSDGDVGSGGDVDYRDNFTGNNTDTDGDGIANEKDIDDDNDGLTDADEAGVSCGLTEVYIGGLAGKMYKANFVTGTVTLMTTSTISGIGAINALASNPDDGVVYYGRGTSMYVYNPATGTHSLVKDFSGEISGSNLESGGAAYYNGYLYIGPEDGIYAGTQVYKIPISNSGLTMGTATAIGDPTSSSDGYGDFIISAEVSGGIMYGSSGITGSSTYWKYNINTATKTIISSSAVSPYQIAVDIYGRKWAADGTSLQKIDSDGNFYGSIITLPEIAQDMTGPFNCPQGDLSKDNDGDGVPNYLDIDSDDDGITDVIEAGGTDPDHDGKIGTGPVVDTDGDGWGDIVDSDNGGSPLPNPNTDNAGEHNFLDLDSDNDGIPDNIEAQATLTYLTADNNDADGDGLDDQYDPTNGGTYLVPIDFDGVGDPDYISLDADGDGVGDVIESGLTLANSDSDGDGLDDNVDATSGYDDPNGNINNPSTDLLDDDGDVNSGGDVDYRDITDDSGGLPIELLDFYVEEYNQTKAMLHWNTASERNNKEFILERSSDKMEFEKIAILAGKINSNSINSYQFLDLNPKTGINYYRLTQIDMDGSKSMSHIVTFALGNQNQFVFYPNPTKNSFIAFSSEDAKLVIRSLDGRIIKTQLLDANAKKSIGISELAKGIYILEYKSSTAQISKRLSVL